MNEARRVAREVFGTHCLVRCVRARCAYVSCASVVYTRKVGQSAAEMRTDPIILGFESVPRTVQTSNGLARAAAWVAGARPKLLGIMLAHRYWVANASTSGLNGSTY